MVTGDERFALGRMQNPVRGFLHGSAALLAFVGWIIMLVTAPTPGSKLAVTVFGLTMVGLYVVSSLYHSIPWSPRWKSRMQRADHAMILIFIAGTYTPIAVIALDGWIGWVSLAAAWAIAGFGVVRHIVVPEVRGGFSVALMVTLGWLAVFIMIPLIQRAGFAPAIWFAIGGVIYTVGMVLVATNRPRLWPRVFSYHEVFHVLVVAASALHFAATLRFVVPLAA
jgi:hemolysin III